MEQHRYGTTYKTTAADNYERYFVPVIGKPVALDLIEVAAYGPEIAC